MVEGRVIKHHREERDGGGIKKDRFPGKQKRKRGLFEALFAVRTGVS
jgi:hypothetical protein